MTHLVGLKSALRAIEWALGDGAHSMPQSQIVAGTVAFWACTIDEALWGSPEYEVARNADPNGRIIPGLRLGRNAIAHGVVVCAAPTGLVYPLFADGTLDYGHDVWKELEGVEAGQWLQERRDTDSQRRSYVAHLQGRPVAEPLEGVRTWFAGLEPQWG